MNRLLIVILAALSMLGALSIDAYLPALPAIAEQFGVGLGAAQQSLTAYVFAFAVMTLFYGTLSDSFGRRVIVLWSLVFYLLGTIGAACSRSLETLIIFRLLQGFSAGGGAVVARAMVADLFTGAEAHRVMSYVNVVFGLAPALAPIIGGWLLAGFGWRAIFWFIALFTVVLMVACYTALPESLPPDKRQKFQPRVVLASYWEVGSHPFFLLRSLSLAMAYAGIMIYVGAAPVYVMHILRLGVTDFGWLFVPLIGGMTAGSVAAGWLSQRVKTPLVISTGFCFMVLGGFWNVIYAGAFTQQPLWAVLPLSVFSFGAALCSPAMSMITLEMFPKYRGLSASLQTFLFMMLFALVSGLVVPRLPAAPLPFAISMLGGVLLCIIFWAISTGAPVRPASEARAE
jgi:DHA1 family bicyclomycin/chloramphenicol resistance-like MFS transporter